MAKQISNERDGEKTKTSGISIASKSAKKTLGRSTVTFPLEAEQCRCHQRFRTAYSSLFAAADPPNIQPQPLQKM